MIDEDKNEIYVSKWTKRWSTIVTRTILKLLLLSLLLVLKSTNSEWEREMIKCKIEMLPSTVDKKKLSVVWIERRHKKNNRRTLMASENWI